MVNFQEFKSGELASVDMFILGMLKCKVLEVIEPGDGKSVKGKVKVKYTAGPFKGQEEVCCTTSVVPRTHLVRRSHQIRIRTNYAWVK